MIPHIYNGQGTISLMIDGVMKPVDTAHKYYEEIKEALKAQKWDIIPDLVNIKVKVEAAIAASATAYGTVTIENGEVQYNGKVVHNSLTHRIVGMAKDGFDIGHMVKFLECLMENPSFRAVNELYDFLEVGGIPITEKGTFLGYKKIKDNWTDIHSGKNDNSIGAVVTMPRNEVDENSANTCSAGLHICSYDYLSQFSSCGNDRVVICEINPRDVVSIPTDYNNTKMRVCKYSVVGEVEDYRKKDTLKNTSMVYTEDVASGATEGTVSHMAKGSTAKEIGKDVTSALKSAKINGLGVETACLNAGLIYKDAYHILEHINGGSFKRAGKRVATHIKNGEMDSNNFVEEFNKQCTTVTPTATAPAPADMTKGPGAKQIGKDVTAALYNGNINPQVLKRICVDAGMMSDDAEYIEDHEYKRVGKKIARAITHRYINANEFVLEFNAAKITVVDTTEDEDEETCGRCGEELTDGYSECPDCGFYN